MISEIKKPEEYWHEAYRNYCDATPRHRLITKIDKPLIDVAIEALRLQEKDFAAGCAEVIEYINQCTKELEI